MEYSKINFINEEKKSFIVKLTSVIIYILRNNIFSLKFLFEKSLPEQIKEKLKIIYINKKNLFSEFDNISGFIEYKKILKKELKAISSDKEKHYEYYTDKFYFYFTDSNKKISDELNSLFLHFIKNVTPYKVPFFIWNDKIKKFEFLSLDKPAKIDFIESILEKVLNDFGVHLNNAIKLNKFYN